MAERQRPTRANFDVAVLFHNRARQTIECILSFLRESMLPEIVVLDQGSAAEQRGLLDEAVDTWPNVRIVSSRENIGVAAGRNRLCRECTSEWVLFVDNDITLGTKEGVALMNSALVHCDVDGLCPAIFNAHDDVYLTRNRLAESAERVAIERIEPETSETNLFPGGGVVLRRSLLLGTPYDERYFVGFEDFDIATTRFLAGRPLRLGILDEVTLLHKHMPSLDQSNVHAAETRYDSSLLASSFAVLKSKGVEGLFEDWEPWAMRQRRELTAPRRTAARASSGSLHIVTIGLLPRRSASALIRSMGERAIEGSTLSALDHAPQASPGQSLRSLVESSPDLVHFLWPSLFAELVHARALRECASLLGIGETEVVDRLCESRITLSVGADFHLDRGNVRALRPLFWLADGYYVTSHELFRAYQERADYPDPMAALPDPTDPRSLWRFFMDVTKRADSDVRAWKRLLVEKFFMAQSQSGS